MQKREVKLGNMIAYGVGDLYGGGAFFIVGSLFLFFLVQIVGMSPAQAGLLFAIGKIWDAVIDPVLGYLTDHTKSKFGRRRIFFLIGIVPVFISFVLLWISVDLSPSGKFIYYLFAYMLFSTVCSMMLIPYNTLSAEMTNDFKVRTRMTSIRMFFSQGSVFIAALFANRIINMFPDKRNGYLLMGIIFAAIFSIPWIFVFRYTWENENAVIEEKSNMSDEMKKVFVDFASTMKNKSFKAHLAMYIGAYVAMDFMNALLMFFVTYYLAKPYLFSNVYAVVPVTQLICIPLIMFLCLKFGNAVAYRISVGIWLAGSIMFSMTTHATPDIYVILIAVIIGMGLSGAVLIPWNMLPFTTDVDELITRKRREGIYAGLMTFIRQIANALAVFMTGTLLDSIGFVAKQTTQSASTLDGLQKMFLIMPVIFMIFGIISSFKFKLSADNHKIVLNEIERLKNANGEKVIDEKTKKVCEDVSGLSYENLWK